MRNWEIIDESREALLDRLFLIYTRTADAVGRYSEQGDKFDIFRPDYESMDAEDLDGILEEFYTLCKNPYSWDWTFFPENAHNYCRLFPHGSLNPTECRLLEKFIKKELPLLREYMDPTVRRSPLFDFLRNVSGRAAQILIK